MPRDGVVILTPGSAITCIPAGLGFNLNRTKFSPVFPLLCLHEEELRGVGCQQRLVLGTFGLAKLVQESTVTTMSTTMKWMPSPPLFPETTSCKSGPSHCLAYGRNTCEATSTIQINK